MSAPLDPDRVSTTDLAAILGVTERTVANLSKRAVLQQVARGKYALAASVQAFVRYTSTGEGAKDAAEARKRVMDEQHRKLKLENDTKESMLYNADDVHAVIDDMAQNFRSQLEGLPGRLANELSGMTEPALIRKSLQDEHRRTLAAVAGRFQGLGALCPSRDSADPTTDSDG